MLLTGSPALGEWFRVTRRIPPPNLVGFVFEPRLLHQPTVDEKSWAASRPPAVGCLKSPGRHGKSRLFARLIPAVSGGRFSYTCWHDID